MRMYQSRTNRSTRRFKLEKDPHQTAPFQHLQRVCAVTTIGILLAFLSLHTPIPSRRNRMIMNANCVRPNPWLDRFFDEVERGFTPERSNYVPAVDVVETADAYNVRVELPGVPKESLTVEVKDNRLVLSGRKEAVAQSEEGRYRYSESRSGNFSRVFQIPRNVKSDAIEAEHKDGVLNLRIPKAEETKPKTVEIK